jgi:glycosyltransferase involved in cell wall biosynthesis
MNLLFVSSLFPNSLEPNRGIYSLQIVREMARLGELKVVAPVASLGKLAFLDSLKNYRTNLPVPECETIDGLSVYHPKYFAVPKMGFLHPLTLQSVLAPLIGKIHAEWGIDAVNCHWICPDGVAVQRICASLGIPVMLTPLGCDLNSYLGFRLRKGAIQNALLGADRVSVLNRQMLETCNNLGMSSSRLTVIPNGVDTEKFTILDRRMCRKKLGLPVEGKIILFVGTLDPVKGIETLLRAFATLTRTGPALARLIIVGGGFLEQDLRRLSDRLEVTESVLFVGAVKHEELPFWMNSADCLCLPSLREGHPNVMMESLACGTPVVASHVGSVPDFVDTVTGWTSRPSDPEDLAAKLVLCLSKNYDREAVRNRVADHTWKKCALRYLDEIGKILHGRLILDKGSMCEQETKCAE